jgi:hypothetical protein
VSDTTRRGFVAALLAFAGCTRTSTGDDPQTTDCHYEAQSVEHIGVLELSNRTDDAVSFDVTVRDGDGDAVFARAVGADAGERTAVFRTGEGGDYTVEYAPASGYGVTDWRVPASGSTRRLTLVVTETDAGQPAVDAHASTADPPATRVCE